MNKAMSTVRMGEVGISPDPYTGPVRPVRRLKVAVSKARLMTASRYTCMGTRSMQTAQRLYNNIPIVLMRHHASTGSSFHPLSTPCACFFRSHSYTTLTIRGLSRDSDKAWLT